MKRYFVLLCAVLTMTLLPTSCLKSNDATEATTYNDMAVSSFDIGTLKRTIQTATETKKTTIDASSYIFHIDQLQRRIFNTDSLPVGTDITKVPCSITAYNNGAIFFESQKEEGVLDIYSSSDSIDFSTPRKLRVYAYATANYSTYTVTLNVHKEEADVFRWTNMGTSDMLKSLTDVRLLTHNELLVMAGQRAGSTVLFSSADGKTWQQRMTNVSPALSADAYANTLCFDDFVYTLSNGTLLRSADLQEWETVNVENDDDNLKRLVAAGTTELYATNGSNQMMVSRDGGYTWEQEITDVSADLLPEEDLAYVCYPYSKMKETDYVLLAGNRNATVYPQDKASQVWHKIVDYSTTSMPTLWTYMEVAENNIDKFLPRMTGLTLVKYDDRLLAVGIYDGGLTIFESKDGGLVWDESSTYLLPDKIDLSMPVSVCTDSDNYIWIVQYATGQVWRGRLNRLGWE